MACTKNCAAQGRVCTCPPDREGRPAWPKPNPPKPPTEPRR